MEVLAGKVRHFYDRLSVASVEVIHLLRVGDRVHVKGHVTDFDQTIQSMQAGLQEIEEASKDMIVGIKVTDYVRKNDCIYKIENPA